MSSLNNDLLLAEVAALSTGAAEVRESLPVLDIGRLDRGGAERAAFLAGLRAAARGPGFFYLTGHGIAPELIDELRRN